jgi:hypothetical protein
MTTAAEYAEQILAEIHQDMERPFPWGKQIPRDVGSFSCLHDYCDANDYLIDGIPFDGPECTCPKNRSLQEDHSETCAAQGPAYAEAWDAYTDLCNEVTDIVDRRLAAEAIELNTGERCGCGRLVRFVSDHVIHIDGDRSHQCEPCRFCLYCPTCHRPLEDRGPFDGRLPSSGVTDGHEGFGETYVCEHGHWFTWLQGALVPPERILTVVERSD